MLRYGVPLDSRTHLTKTDWSFWSATLAENQADFEAIIAPIYDYLNETTARDPIADSYVTDKIHSGGMHARPVVGGFFIKMLTDRAVWKKWASRDKLKPANWAPLPAPPKISMLVPTEQTWRYTTQKPGDDWMKTDFDATGWKEGRAGFGTQSAGIRAAHDLDDRRHLAAPRDHDRRGRASAPAVHSPITTRTWRSTSTESWPRRKAGSRPATCRWKSRAKRVPR